ALFAVFPALAARVRFLVAPAAAALGFALPRILARLRVATGAAAAAGMVAAARAALGVTAGMVVRVVAGGGFVVAPAHGAVLVARAGRWWHRRRSPRVNPRRGHEAFADPVASPSACRKVSAHQWMSWSVSVRNESACRSRRSPTSMARAVAIASATPPVSCGFT